MPDYRRGIDSHIRLVPCLSLVDVVVDLSPPEVVGYCSANLVLCMAAGSLEDYNVGKVAGVQGGIDSYLLIGYIVLGDCYIDLMGNYSAVFVDWGTVDFGIVVASYPVVFFSSFPLVF